MSFTLFWLWVIPTEFSMITSYLGWNKWISDLCGLQMGADAIQELLVFQDSQHFWTQLGISLAATPLKISWHFQCWSAPQNSSAKKKNWKWKKCLEIFQNLSKVCITSGNGAILAKIRSNKMEWTELFKFPVDALSLILFLYSSFPAVYCWVQNDVSFQGT